MTVQNQNRAPMTKSNYYSVLMFYTLIKCTRTIFYDFAGNLQTDVFQILYRAKAALLAHIIT